MLRTRIVLGQIVKVAGGFSTMRVLVLSLHFFVLLDALLKVVLKILLDIGERIILLVLL